MVHIRIALNFFCPPILSSGIFVKQYLSMILAFLLSQDWARFLPSGGLSGSWRRAGTSWVPREGGARRGSASLNSCLSSPPPRAEAMQRKNTTSQEPTWGECWRASQRGPIRCPSSLWHHLLCSGPAWAAGKGRSRHPVREAEGAQCLPISAPFVLHVISCPASLCK